MKLFGILVSISIPLFTYANNGIRVLDGTELPGDGTIEDFEQANVALSSVISRGMDIVAMGAVIGVIIVGYLFITSQGDEEKTKKAIKYSLVIGVGLGLAFGAFALVALIDQIPETFF